MPYKDHEKKLAAMRRWRKEKMQEGYGHWLYARRKLRFDDADRFRGALQQIMDGAEDPVRVAAEALSESKMAEIVLGDYDEWKANNEAGAERAGGVTPEPADATDEA